MKKKLFKTKKLSIGNLALIAGKKLKFALVSAGFLLITLNAFSQTTITLEAENATLSGGASVATNHTGYSGSGFIEGYWNQGATTTFTVDAAAAGSYDISLTYCNGNGNSHTISIYVNGSKIKQTTLAPTGSWDSWGTATETLNLIAGSNSIAYMYDTGDNGSVNLDYITVPSGTPDTQTPSVPSGLVVSSLTETSFTLAWAASSDNVAVTAYEVFQDGVSIGTTASASMSVSGLLSATTYAMTVRAADAASNWSALSAVLNVTTATTIANRYEAENAVLSGGASIATNHTGFSGAGFIEGYGNVGASTALTVNVVSAGTYNVSLGYSNGGGQSSVSIYVNGTKIQQTQLTPTGNWDSWNSKTEVLALNAGNNTIAYQFDAGDGGYINLDYIDVNSGTQDTEAPTIPLGLNAANVGTDSFDLSWTASTDNVGVTAYEVFQDGVSLGTTTSTSIAITGLSSGTVYSMTVRATDAAGNWSAASSSLSVSTQNSSMVENGLTGEYYNNTTLLGTPVLTRVDPSVSFLMWAGSPDASITNDNFSIRWTGQVEAPVSGDYIFQTYSDDGVKLWVNGNLIINNWAGHAPTTDVASAVSLTAGQKYDLILEYFEGSGDAVIRLDWSYPGQGTQTVPQSQLFTAVGTSVDTQAPSVPNVLTASNISQSSFTLSWNASTDNVGVTGYEVFRNGTSIGTTSGTSINVSTLLCGNSYNMTVSATDAAGNWSDQSVSLPVSTGSCGMYPIDLGMNWFYNADWDFGFIFADVVKQGRNWAEIYDWNTPAPIDANGWPTKDAKIILVATGLSGMQGTFKLKFDASTPNVNILAAGDLTNPSGCVTITNKVYNNGTFTADVNVASNAFDGPGFLALEFQNTGDGIRNVQCMMPGQQFGDVFSNLMMNSIGLFSTIRPMQMVGEPNSHVVNWSERRSPFDPSQANSSAGIGVAYEYLIMWANAVQKDLWLCLPRLANDDFITKVAQLCKYGSNGVIPYTSPQANPVFPPLDPDLNLYIEYSNEVWNYAHDEAVTIAVDIVNNQGDPIHLNWDNSGNIHYWAWEYTAYNTVRISNIFRSVFGDAQMPSTGNSRIRPVLAGQINRYVVDIVGLQYIDNVWGSNNTFGNPQHPVNYYLYALSGAPYPGFNDTQDGLTVDEIFHELFDRMSGTGGGSGWNTFDQIDDLKIRADQYGLHMNAYEGGQSLIGFGHSEEAKAACQDDPRMKQLTKDLITKWFSVTDGVFCYFTMGRASDWFAIGNGYLDNNTQKWQALYELTGTSAKSTDLEEVSGIVNTPNLELSDDFKISPNPATDKLNICIENASIEMANIIINDLNGRIILNSNRVLTNGKNNMELDLSAFKEGIYIIKISTNSNLLINKLIVR